LKQVQTDIGAFEAQQNVHLAEVIKFAVRELNKAYGQKQGTV
jgi:hypothetical protein